MRLMLFLLGFTGALLAADLPVKTVILYKHGVGYFERSGQLTSGESARLDFKASDMNDVLKSLTIEDKSGSKITGLRYDASEPLEKRLADYPFQIGQSKSLPDFLDQLKGSKLTVKTISGEVATGVIFGARRVPWGDKAGEKEVLVLVLDSGEMHTYDLATLTSLKLADGDLERQMKDYLSTLAVARSKDKRSVYIDSTDARARSITASYMTPMPAWKSSYRLILKDSEAVLEGWAIVDNTTGEDWTKVRLALVSGRPISFISQLYEPRFRIRPTAELPEDRAVAPPVYAGGVMQTEALAGRAAVRKDAAMPPPAPASAPAGFGGSYGFGGAYRAEMQSSIASTAGGREIGDLFEYSFSSPVTVRKNESAMLPFLQQKIGARKLLIYSDHSLGNPMNAAEITNNSGKTLDGGPITVYESGTYAGEALVETFKAADKRLTSYGIDLGTRITTNLDSSRDLMREFHANRGMITTKNAVQETRTYSIRNVDPKAKTLLIEHPIRPEYKVLNQKPVETTDKAYRFEVKLAANATAKYEVIEEYVYDQSTAISSLPFEQLTIYVQNKKLSADGRRQLEEVAAQKKRIADVEAALRTAEREAADIGKDQDRVRQNIESLNRVTGQQAQVQKYAQQLASQEAKLATLRDRASELRREVDTQQQALNAMIERISF